MMCTALLPAMAAFPLAPMEGQVYPQILLPDNYELKSRRHLLETCNGRILVEKSIPSPRPATLPVAFRLSLDCFCLVCGKICPRVPRLLVVKMASYSATCARGEPA